MEHKTETTDDELIAAIEKLPIHFRQWDQRTVYLRQNHWHLPETFKYKTSFNWIMPVVEKINSGVIDDYTCISIDKTVVFVFLKGDDYQTIEINGDLIGAIYRAVLIVLRWAEERKPLK